MTVKFILQGITKYPISLIDMEIAREFVNQESEECVFITEHESLYSAGKSFEQTDFLFKPKFPIYFSKRGGRVTVHSPGQLVIYPIINLKKRNLNVSVYVEILENWIMDSLKEFEINAELSKKGIGVWLNGAKVGFIGIRIENGISTHGLCLNISNDLSMFNAIIPCGINGVKITSLEQTLNKKFQLSEVSDAFIKNSPFLVL